jgi:uncharacterized protein (TIGR03085 family)
MGSPSLARRERHALCDLALLLGEDAPTVLPDWTAKDLVVHLLVREYSPIGALGLAVGPLSGLTEREMARVGRRDFTVLVERLRGRGLTPYSLGPVDRVANSLEYFVHHEDLRRAQPDWQPRDLPVGDADVVWRLLRVFGRGLVRQAGVPVQVVREDTGATTTLRHGADPAVVSGPPGEVALFLFGREQTRDVRLLGPDDTTAALRTASLGF